MTLGFLKADGLCFFGSLESASRLLERSAELCLHTGQGGQDTRKSIQVTLPAQRILIATYDQSGKEKHLQRIHMHLN